MFIYRAPFTDKNHKVLYNKIKYNSKNHKLHFNIIKYNSKNKEYKNIKTLIKSLRK